MSYSCLRFLEGSVQHSLSQFAAGLLGRDLLKFVICSHSTCVPHVAAGKTGSQMSRSLIPFDEGRVVFPSEGQSVDCVLGFLVRIQISPSPPCLESCDLLIMQKESVRCRWASENLDILPSSTCIVSVLWREVLDLSLYPGPKALYIFLR